jgi:type VI secretion system secreted protein Hcp
MAIYMKYEGINGNVEAEGYKDWIGIETLSWGATRHISPTPGKPFGESSTLKVTAVTVTKELDDATPKLLNALYTGTAAMKVSIAFVRTGSPAVEYLSYDLAEAMISEVSTTSSGDRPTETVTLYFQKLTINYIPQLADGSSGAKISVGYSLARMTTV